MPRHPAATYLLLVRYMCSKFLVIQTVRSLILLTALAQSAVHSKAATPTQHRLLPSMSRKGNCYDNAFIESFWSTLKYELVYHHRFATLAAARTAIFDYIETFYNRTRLRSSLAYKVQSILNLN